MENHFKLPFFLMGIIAVVLFGIYISAIQCRNELRGIRSIESEIANAQWIMACDDIDIQEYPMTFADCAKR